MDFCFTKPLIFQHPQTTLKPTCGVKELIPSLTLRAPEAALMIEEFMEVIDSLEPALFIPVGGRPAPECITQLPGLYLRGDLLTLTTGANKSNRGRHSKYLQTL